MLYYAFLIGILDWSSYPYDQCWAVKDTRFDAPGMSLASCYLYLSSRSMVSAPPTRGLSFLSLPLSATCSHSGSTIYFLTLRTC